MVSKVFFIIMDLYSKMWIFPALFFIIYQPSIAFCICPDINLPNRIQFPETTLKDAVIYSSNLTVYSTDSRWTDEGLGVAIRYDTTSSSYQLILSSQADLDEDLNNRCGVKNFNITYSCLEETKQVMFTVLDVNEYGASFRQTSWRTINIDENDPIGTVLTTLRDRFIDRDCFSRYSFKVVPPGNGAPWDIEDHFRLDTEDNLVLVKPFDAEKLKCQEVPGLVQKVNIELWEEDSYEKKYENTVTLTINVTDLDDKEPMFVNPGCTDTCPQCVTYQYDISVTRSDMGTLNVTIKALDPDTADSQIRYSITKVEDKRYKNFFEINEMSGDVSLIKPFAEILNETDVVDDFTVKLTIQATHSSQDDYGSAELVVAVENRRCKDINLPETIQFPETTPKGTVIYNSNITVNNKDIRWRDVGSGVSILFNNTSSSYELVLDLQADIDEDLNNRCGFKDFNISYSCLEKSRQVMFTVLDVNEYSASFQQTSWRSISINENDPSGTVLTTLKNRFVDKDCFSKYSFKIAPPRNAVPGEVQMIEDYFRLDTEDNLVLAKSFDAENLKCQEVPGLLKEVNTELYEEDSYEKKKEDTVTLTIAIKDLDDQEPMFVKAGCTNTCPQCVISQYDISVTTSDMGTLNVMIKALDPDTTDSQILYSITKVEDKRYENLFEINEITGDISLMKPFAETLNGTGVVDDFIVKLTIKASHSSQGDSVKTVLLVAVENLLNNTRTRSADEDSSLLLLILVPVAAVVVVGVIIVIIVIVVWSLKRSEKKPSSRRIRYIVKKVKGSNKEDKTGPCTKVNKENEYMESLNFERDVNVYQDLQLPEEQKVNSTGNEDEEKDLNKQHLDKACCEIFAKKKISKTPEIVISIELHGL